MKRCWKVGDEGLINLGKAIKFSTLINNFSLSYFGQVFLLVEYLQSFKSENNQLSIHEFRSKSEIP